METEKNCSSFVLDELIGSNFYYTKAKLHFYKKEYNEAIENL